MTEGRRKTKWKCKKEGQKQSEEAERTELRKKSGKLLRTPCGQMDSIHLKYNQFSRAAEIRSCRIVEKLFLQLFILTERQKVEEKR